jgi:hypothetical protein
MSILRVEQLEPRQMLSGVCFTPESSPPPSTEAGSPDAWVADRRSFVDFGPDRYNWYAPTWSHTVIVERVGPQPTPVLTIRFPTINEGTPRSAPAPGGSGAVVGDDADGVRILPATQVARSPAGTEIPRETTAVSAPPASPVGINLQPAALIDLAGAAAIRLALPALVGVAPSIPGVGGRDEFPGPTGTVSPSTSIPASPTGGSEGDRQSLPITPDSPPSLSSVLSVLPPLDLAGLERGLRQFVAQLESTGQTLLRPVERSEFWPWIVAAAAALAACEIARREFRSSESRAPIDSFEF